MSRIALPLVALLMGGVAPVCAQVTRTPEYFAAESAFNNRLDLDARVVAQLLLIATGHQNSVPTERFTSRTYAALSRFQAENGLYPTGSLTTETEAKLGKSGREMLDFWNFEVIRHPVENVPIWVPQGMGLRPSPNRNGLTFIDPQKRLSVSYNSFPNGDVYAAYEALKAKMQQEGTVIHYAVAKEGWYVISSTAANGNDQYMRYHQYGRNVLGFSLFWNNRNGDVHAERVAVMMSASLGAALNGRPMVQPPGSGSVTTVAKAEMPPTGTAYAAPVPAAAPPSAPVAAPQTSPAAPVPPVTPKAEDKISTGSGFLVDASGNFVTNAHVVKGCDVVVVKLNDNKVAHKTRIVATDPANDLALLALDGVSGNRFAPVRVGGRLGESVAAFGYPHADVLASSGNFTIGNITALAGINDDSRYYQVSTPVQSGNSGGPLLDNYGNVVGVVSNKLNVIKMAALTGDMPQNVNFAIKGTTLVQFLESNSVSATIGSTSQLKNDPADVADDAKAVSGFVACQ